MSIKLNGASPTINTSGLAGRSFSGGFTPVTGAWVRNPSWLTFAAPLETDQKFIGLHAVYPGDGTGTGGNFLALSAAGDYTVDWGDGTAPINYPANVTAYHEFDYNNAALAGTNAPVTFTASTSTINRIAHGYTNGMTVRFYNIVTTTGLSEGTPYYVVNATADTFQVSDISGGSAISLTNDGSATLLPYKQSIVTVTPQADNSLTALNLHKKYLQGNLQSYTSGFLDIAISSALLTSLLIGVSTLGGTSQDIRFTDLEQVNIVKSSIKTADSLFYNCYKLSSVIGIATNISPARYLPVTFTDSADLITAPGHGLVNGDPVVLTSLSSTTGISIGTRYFVISATADTFQVSFSYNGSASTLTNDGFGTFAVGTSMNYMFYNCFSLTSVPLFNTAAVINMNGMFNNCYSLQNVPLFNTASVVNMSAMFIGCYSLYSVPLFNTSNVANMASMLSNCYSLVSVPLFNTEKVINTSYMFYNCYSLISVPSFNTEKVTSMNYMFSNCYSLESVPVLNTSAVTNMSYLFNGCYSLKYVPVLNTSAVISMDFMFYNCYSLVSVPLFNTQKVTSMSYMFYNCYSLASVPLFNTEKVTSMSYMFQNCYSLVSVPLFNTAAVTSMSSMFQNCYSLKRVPSLNTSAATGSFSFSSMFVSCINLSRIQAKEFKYTFSVASCKLSATALNEIYANLPTVTGQTITVSGNYGTASDNPTIATAKGWTVTG